MAVVPFLAGVHEGRRHCDLGDGELEALAVLLPVAHVLDSARHEPACISRDEGCVFDLEGEAMQEDLLADDPLGRVVQDNDRQIEFCSYPDEKDSLIVVSDPEGGDDRNLRQRQLGQNQVRRDLPDDKVGLDGAGPDEQQPPVR